MAEAQEYMVCSVLHKKCHYTEFDKAGFGWLSIDGSKRHSQSKIGKRVNQTLVNGLRMTVGKKLVFLSDSTHPHHELWKKTIKQIRSENPEYNKPLLRTDLSREAYLRMYESIGIEIPDVDKVRHKKGRKSTNGTSCLNYLNVLDDDKHREVRIDKYYVDGLKDNDVYEFFGDYWHANPDIYLAEDMIFRSTAKEKWEKDKKRAEVIKLHGYNFYVIWESEWNKFQNGISKELKIIKW